MATDGEGLFCMGLLGIPGLSEALQVFATNLLVRAVTGSVS